MIKTVGDLLEQLVATEREKLAEYALPHPGIIGDMYEGLTHQISRRSLVPRSDLRVVKGMIRNSKGTLSRQIDCMIVEGEGERVPHSEHWIYPAAQVVAVIEVKKSLYGGDLMDAMNLMADLTWKVFEPREVSAALLRDAWRSITATVVPSADRLRHMQPKEEYLFRGLLVEANVPLRVVLGYEGYASESSLRQGVVDLISRGTTGGAAATWHAPGPIAMPSLVICRSASLVKLNGMPYPGPYWPMTGDWGFFGSRGARPMHVFLELLWTRLNYYHDAPPSIFGEDLELDGINLLLRARFVNNGGQLGWGLTPYKATDAELQEGPETEPWMPAVLSDVAFAVIQVLCSGGPIALSDPGFVGLWGDDATRRAVIEELSRARLAYDDQGTLRLLTDECACAIVPGVGSVAGENKTGRFERWLMRRLSPTSGSQ